MKSVEAILDAYRGGNIALTDAVEQINASYFQDLEHSTIDHDRARRTGAPEVIYAEYKSPSQILEAFDALARRGSDVLATRVDADAGRLITEALPDASYNETARTLTLKQSEHPPAATTIAVITAGTSDLAVAEEAAITAEFYDNPVTRINDVGVAGIHRLLARVDEIRQARVVVVVAGMEGALPSVVGGLIDKPVIAVPTSIGYGASFGGVAALLGMLNSCSAGVSVVNIDNGFGAGVLASMINRQ